MDTDILRRLVCPSTGCRLRLSEDGRYLIAERAKLVYPIRDGVPILKVSEARNWESEDDNIR